MKNMHRKLINASLLFSCMVLATGCAQLGFLGGLGSLIGGLAVGGGIAAFASAGSSGGGASFGGAGQVLPEAFAQFNVDPGVSAFANESIQTVVSPEPATMLLLGSGMAMMAYLKHRSQ